MTWSPQDLGDHAGRTFVVTGANSGIGFETARALVERGARVVLAVRDTARGEEAASQLGSPGSTSVVELDLADLDEVAGCAKRILDGHENLSGLICNAGVMGGPFLKSAQGFELQMATNHLGHAALIAALWPLLEKSSSRIVLLSSNEAKRGQLSPKMTGDELLKPEPYDGKQVYRNTKQANLLFAQELHRRCKDSGVAISVVAVHPGTVSTNLFARQLDRAGRSSLGSVSKIITKVLLSSPATGARGTLRALDESTPSGAFVAPAGFAQLRGRPVLAQVYPSANDPATAARLWELTEQVLGPQEQGAIFQRSEPMSSDPPDSRYYWNGSLLITGGAVWQRSLKRRISPTSMPPAGRLGRGNGSARPRRDPGPRDRRTGSPHDLADPRSTPTDPHTSRRSERCGSTAHSGS